MARNIEDDPSIVQPIFRTLKNNFETGATRPVQFRKQALKRLLDGYIAMQDQLSGALKLDLGINDYAASFSAHFITQAEFKDMIDHVSNWAKPSSVSTPLGLGIASCSIEYEPLGVAIVISAWNYPIYTAMPQVAAAIAAGNSVILKPSELASHTSGALKKLFDKYLDPNYYQVIEGRVEVAKAVTRLQSDVICFTGSTSTGRLVAIEAAKNLIPCVLELGGKCPVVVDESANIATAVNRILFGKFLNCGQTCIGVDHVYVHEDHRQVFKKLLLSKMQQFYGGSQNLQQTGDYGKIINEFHIDRIERFLKDNHKGNIIYGGTVKKESRFITPTAIENPDKQSLLMRDQIFGPILPFFYYSQLDEVIKEINSRPKPLVVYLFSESKKNIHILKQRTSSGAFVVNDAIIQMTNLALPFGGVGASGYGRFHGKEGFIAFSNAKSVALISSMDSFPVNQRYPPYTDSKKAVMNTLLKVAFVSYGQVGKVLLLVVAVIVAIVLAAVLL